MFEYEGEYVQAVRAYRHTYDRTFVTIPFYPGITGTKSLSGSYLHPIV